MVFNDSLIAVLLVVLSAWVTIISVLVFRMMSHYNGLTRGISRAGLKEVLEVMLSSQRGLKKREEELTVELERVAKAGKFHIQRIGIVRFNPFDDTGGAQSFTMAILDGKDSGIVITSLYARNSNRWYVKEVVEGRGKDVELSKEEVAAIKKAKPII